jgi:hypothetical protein
MKEDDDDDEWQPQQFYLDVISEACEPIGGELSGQFLGQHKPFFFFFFFFLFCFVVRGFCFLCPSVCPSG